MCAPCGTPVSPSLTPSFPPLHTSHLRPSFLPPCRHAFLPPSIPLPRSLPLSFDPSLVRSQLVTSRLAACMRSADQLSSYQSGCHIASEAWRDVCMNMALHRQSQGLGLGRSCITTGGACRSFGRLGGPRFAWAWRRWAAGSSCRRSIEGCSLGGRTSLRCHDPASLDQEMRAHRE